MTSATRTRRYRQRRREGVVMVILRLNPAGVQGLVDLDWLGAGAPPREAQAALLQLIERPFDERVRPCR
jgi:hypothetical protein